MSSKFAARLNKLESIAGNADEDRHWRAVLELQPALKDMYWRSQSERWPVMKYLDVWQDMHRGLPPLPERKNHDPNARQRLIDEVLQKLNGTSDRMDHAADMLGYDLDAMKEQIREREAAYLQSEEHRAFVARLQTKE